MLNCLNYSYPQRSQSHGVWYVHTRELLEKSKETLGDAHATQTSLIQGEAAGDKCEVSLLLVHAQDHLMTSIVVKDLAEEIIDLHEKLNKVEFRNE